MRIKLRRSLLLGVMSALITAVAGSLSGAGLLAAAAASTNARAAKNAHAKKAHKKKTHKKTGLALGEGPTEKGATKAVRRASEIPLAPTWTESQLNAEPSGNWITSEGGTTGDHYSQLKQINTHNVARLKAAWMTQLDGSGLAPKYSGEAPPVEYKGVIYYATGADDIFAVSVANGKILWVHKGELPEAVNDVCCGWDNRGVTLGDGKVYSAVLNGSIEALNQKTGKVAWKTELGNPTDGYTVTSAPLYYNGMIFIGPVGADYGIRGFMEALNAKTGKEIWRHHNIPGPGEAGHNTWPIGTSCQQCNQEWENGGASTWNAPTVNDKTGLIYYSTGNAGGDYQGVTRAGANLWTASILAVHYKTGKFAWGYQEVHHDIWDLDASSQPLMIRVKIHGKTVEGIDHNSKEGFSYFIDDVNGKPVFPIPEKAVPQNAAADASYPTQPIPTMPRFEPANQTTAGLEEAQKALDEQASKAGITAPTVTSGLGYNGTDLFYPWPMEGESTVGTTPNGSGGDTEAVPSFDPVTGDLYVCSYFTMGVATKSTEVEKPTHGEKSFYGGFDQPGTLTVYVTASAKSALGFVTAYNMHTGKIIWQDKWPHPCYYGNLTTAGNLLFVANIGGEELAYNAQTGKELWHFALGAGGGIATSFEFKGKEYVAVYAGGNEEGGILQGDNLWAFTLNGNGPHGIPFGKTPKPSKTLK